MAFIPIAAGHRSSAQQKTVIHRFREAGAVGRKGARPLRELGPLQGRRVERLIDQDVIRKTSGGAYYLDEDALSDLHARQRTIAWSVIVVVVGVFAAWFLVQ